MESHEFDIIISPGGQVKIDIKGVKGPGCMEYAKLFQKLLGEAQSVEQTAEYYEPPTGVDIHLHDQAQ